MNVLLVVSVLSGAVISTQQTSTESWRSAENCGANSLYAYLRLNDKNVSYDSVCAAIGSIDGGASFKQLRDVANGSGVPSVLVRCDVSAMRRATLPAIVHLSGVRDGHFVVLLRIDNTQVVLGDGIECDVKDMSVSAFERLWSGFALVPGDSYWNVVFSNSELYLLVVLTLVSAISLLVTTFRSLRMATRRTNR